MLQKQAVTPSLFRLLEKLSKIPEFNNLYLVGGTALALRLGHRESIDIDLFGKVNKENILNELYDINLKNISVLKSSKNINVFTIDSVKVDFVNYRYDWLKDPVVIDNIRFASFEDIAAMKLNAITGRGSKKDFIDLYFLLKIFTLSEIFGFYREKYTDGNIFLVKKSLSYFNDAETERMPKMFKDITWAQVKREIINSVRTK